MNRTWLRLVGWALLGYALLVTSADGLVAPTSPALATLPPDERCRLVLQRGIASGYRVVPGRWANVWYAVDPASPDATSPSFARRASAALDLGAEQLAAWSVRPAASGPGERFQVCLVSLDRPGQTFTVRDPAEEPDGRAGGDAAEGWSFALLSTTLATEPWERLVAVATHEYYHGVQCRYAACRALRDPSLAWLTEGSAEWAAVWVVGEPAYRQTYHNMAAALRAMEGGLTMSAAATRARVVAAEPAYRGVLFFHFLADNVRVDFTGAGPAGVGRGLWEALERTGDWRVALSAVLATPPPGYERLDERLVAGSAVSLSSLDLAFLAFTEAHLFPTLWYPMRPPPLGAQCHEVALDETVVDLAVDDLEPYAARCWRLRARPGALATVEVDGPAAPSPLLVARVYSEGWYETAERAIVGLRRAGQFVHGAAGPVPAQGTVVLIARLGTASDGASDGHTVRVAPAGRS
ncbi:MAG TPA: hypothetical protein VIN09_08280 [Chloroflexota bacterium]